MDLQATLNRTIKHLHAQGGAGQQHNGCFYKTMDGRKSALGCLIPDEYYYDSLEDRNPADLPRSLFDAIGADTDDEVAFLVAIENAHDTAARITRSTGECFWTAWAAALLPIASRHHLSLALLEDLRLK